MSSKLSVQRGSHHFETPPLNKALGETPVSMLPYFARSCNNSSAPYLGCCMAQLCGFTRYPLFRKHADTACVVARSHEQKALKGSWALANRPDILKEVVQGQLAAMKEASTYKHERVITTPQSTSIGVQGTETPVINLCSNNYLGLSNYPDVAAAAIKAINTHGFGLSSVRFICGTQDLHKELEQAIAKFHGTQDAILFPSCFDANAGLFEVLLTDADAVISDELNHASIIDGIRLSKAQRYRFKHMDMSDLDAKLKEATNKGARIKMIATDGVFSMDGDTAPLKEIVALAKKHDAYTFVDDCHATGIVGATGRGSDEHCGVHGHIDIINSTLGKALGGATGGYTTGRKEVVDLLRQRARPYLFSNTLAPAMAGAGLKVFELLSTSVGLRDQLEANTLHFRKRMTDAGFNIKPGSHPIVPVMLGDAAAASEMAELLLSKGIYVIAFSYPVVPKGQARIRCQITAAHTRDQLDAAVDAFVEVGKFMGLLGL